MRVRPYQKLIVWQEAHQLCLAIFAMTIEFPTDERFGLVRQMRDAASSIPTNIAEGNAKRSAKDQRRFLNISIGSLEELHYQCILSRDLQYISEKEMERADDRIQRVGYLLARLRSSLF